MNSWYVWYALATIGFATIAIIGLSIIALLIQLLFNGIVLRLGKAERRISFKSALLFSLLLYFISIPYGLVSHVYSGMVDQMTTFIHNNTEQISFLQSEYILVTIPAEYTSLVDRMKATQESLAREWQTDLLLAIILGGVLTIVWGVSKASWGSKLKRGLQLVMPLLVVILLLIPSTFGYHMFVYAHGDLSKQQHFTVVGQTQRSSGAAGSGSSSFPWEGLVFTKSHAPIWWPAIWWASPIVLLLLGWVGWKGFNRIRQSPLLTPESYGL